MTHRTALALSLVLTLMLGAGVLVGRDRLFAAETSADPPTAPSVAQTTASFPSSSLTGAGPRIVEVPLPAPLGSGAELEQARSNDDERSFERDEDDDDGNDRSWYDDDDDDDEEEDDD